MHLDIKDTSIICFSKLLSFFNIYFINFFSLLLFFFSTISISNATPSAGQEVTFSCNATGDNYESELSILEDL